MSYMSFDVGENVLCVCHCLKTCLDCYDLIYSILLSNETLQESWKFVCNLKEAEVVFLWVSWYSWMTASALLWEVIDYANRISTCRALYLHVIAYNQPAIMFYQKNMFQCMRKLHKFYIIDGQYHDAYLYVYYVNGGRSPCTAM